MKKTNLIYFLGIGLLAFLPFIRVSVALPPCWAGLNVGQTHVFEYTLDLTARDGAYTADGVNLLIYANMDASWMGFINDDEMGAVLPGNMSHEIEVVGDLTADIEHGSGYQVVPYTHWMVYNSTFVNVPWAMVKDQPNVYQGVIIENSTEFVLFHDGLARFFDIYVWTLTTIAASKDLNWTEVATVANTMLAAVNATVTVETDGSEEVGFKISIAALDWGTNTEAVGLSVTFDECGVLDVWDLTYGTDSILKLEQNSNLDCICPTAPPPGIPGFELPVIIGVASIISLILIKKIKKK